MFSSFTLPDVAAVARRTVIAAVLLGAVALVVCLAMNVALAGLGFCVGVAMGITNFRLVQSSVAKVGRRPKAHRRRPLAMNTVSRLAAISAVALALLFVRFDLGFGVLGGIALFQVLLLANVARSMLASATAGGVLGSAHLFGGLGSLLQVGTLDDAESGEPGLEGSAPPLAGGGTSSGQHANGAADEREVG